MIINRYKVCAVIKALLNSDFVSPYEVENNSALKNPIVKLKTILLHCLCQYLCAE